MQYLKYLLFSAHGRGHGIHSPFVFNLVSEVFRNKTGRDVVLIIEKVRRSMMRDHRIIEVTDFGSGSMRLNNSSRRVSDIVKYSSVPKKYGVLLANLASEFGATDIIELGTSLGISTMYLASGSTGVTVHSVEGCTATYSIACENINSKGFNNIRLYNETFDEALAVLRETKVAPGLIFIDGDHRKESVLRYFEKAAEMAGKDTVIVIDDIHLSKQMGEAWDKIRRDRNVSLTVDLNRMGLVFFKEGMTRSDYIIRY